MKKNLKLIRIDAIRKSAIMEYLVVVVLELAGNDSKGVIIILRKEHGSFRFRLEIKAGH